MIDYDLELFLKLNDEWRDRPVVPRPRSTREPGELMEQAWRRAEQVVRHVPLAGKRVLEVGCGRGHFVRVLSREYGCTAVGIDVRSYEEWAGDPRFVQGDIADPPELGQFDVVLSHAVWEHVEHPYTALVKQRELLAPGGVAYLYANLSRGAKASHRYREVYFPWPHLLFTDAVFREFYARLGRRQTRASWVNHLTFAQYVDHFRRIGYGIERVWASNPWWDEEFYRQHWDVLGRYPKWDLRHDFIHAVLTRDAPAEQQSPGDASGEAALRDRIRQLERRIDRLESSRSWRMTAPVRAAGRMIRR